MADPAPPDDVAADGNGEIERPDTPLWVKVFGIVGLVVIVLFVVVLIAGGHGPGRHSSDAPAGHAPFASGVRA
jgi:ABC-type transporter Mla subunit MlaD